MTALQLKEILQSLADDGNREFFSKLTHTGYPVLGTKIPVLRQLAKRIAADGQAEQVIKMRPVLCYEHVMLIGILSAGAKLPLAEKLPLLEEYCTLIDDWALCDVACSCLKFKKREEFSAMADLAASGDPWKARFGLIAINSCFCTREFSDDIAGVLKRVTAEGYYVDMGAAWLVCTLESKVPGAGIAILREGALTPAARKMCVGKMRDSRRIDRKTAAEAAAVSASFGKK